MASFVEALLGFFADLIIFTFGLAVFLFWIFILIAIAVEIYDAFHEKSADQENEDSEDWKS